MGVATTDNTPNKLRVGLVVVTPKLGYSVVVAGACPTEWFGTVFTRCLNDKRQRCKLLERLAAVSGLHPFPVSVTNSINRDV